MKNFLLKAVSISKTYKKNIIALSDFNLVLKEGIILGLIGANGAGKSTFVNILANIVKKDSGEIFLFEKKINEKSYDYKSHCGFVLEKPVYIGKLTIREYLEFAGKMYRLAEEKLQSRMNELLNIFDLPPKNDLWIESYSCGMKKKVSIATALLHGPRILILDEPFTDLDLITIGRLKEIMFHFKKRSKSILIASHNIQELENVCDEIAFVREGKVLFQKSMQEVRKEIEKNNFESFESFLYQYICQNQPLKSLSWL